MKEYEIIQLMDNTSTLDFYIPGKGYTGMVPTYNGYIDLSHLWKLTNNIKKYNIASFLFKVDTDRLINRLLKMNIDPFFERGLVDMDKIQSRDQDHISYVNGLEGLFVAPPLALLYFNRLKIRGKLKVHFFYQHRDIKTFPGQFISGDSIAYGDGKGMYDISDFFESRHNGLRTLTQDLFADFLNSQMFKREVVAVDMDALRVTYRNENSNREQVHILYSASSKKYLRGEVVPAIIRRGTSSFIFVSEAVLTTFYHWLEMQPEHKFKMSRF